MIKFLLISIFVATASLAKGQTVIVNPDGTHTVVIGSGQEGSPQVIVQPNGQHTVVHKTGAHAIAVGPDGRHTVVVGTDQPGSPKILVHPNGKHSVIHSTGAHAVVIGPDGRHTVLKNQPLSLSQTSPAVPGQPAMTTDLQCQLAILLILSFIEYRVMSMVYLISSSNLTIYHKSQNGRSWPLPA